MPAKLLRHAEKVVLTALKDTRVVLVNGARQERGGARLMTA